MDSGGYEVWLPGLSDDELEDELNWVRGQEKRHWRDKNFGLSIWYRHLATTITVDFVRRSASDADRGETQLTLPLESGLSTLRLAPRADA
jgi:hypothetical protein